MHSKFHVVLVSVTLRSNVDLASYVLWRHGKTVTHIHLVKWVVLWDWDSGFNFHVFYLFQ